MRLIEALTGASMAGKIAIYHRMGTLEDEMSTKPERQRARDLVKHALVNGFQEAKRQYRFSMPVEDIEVCYQTHLSVIFQLNRKYVDQASISTIWHMLSM